MDVKLSVNGEEFVVAVDPGEVLLETLRTRLGVKSPKVGCERGDCGSCTVLLDGRTVRSCLVLTVETDGHEVTTVEGLDDDRYQRLQQSLIDLNSFQCGFCAPGIVLAAAELLDGNPQPTRADVQVAIGGNLCRCTGYEPIIDAVLAAAGPEGREHP
jgi:aerobic-type carbon monoxide dehydrogenase small subunit (CoxS/CutS family)